jgi:hypothetical protein
MKEVAVVNANANQLPSLFRKLFLLLLPLLCYGCTDGSQLYVGKDKFENEDLIKYGWPEDIWFHVDNLSSPHVYVRLPEVSAQM